MTSFRVVRHRLMVCALVALSAWGCGDRRPDPPPDGPSPFPELGIRRSNYPRVDGSTSTQPLGVFLACRVLGAGYQWAPWASDDSYRLYASDFDLYLDRDYDGGQAELCDWINATVRHNGTHQAYQNLIKGRTDLILVARAPSDDERRLARRMKVGLDVRAVARDAFVLLLHEDNPVTELSVEEVRDIYSGRIVNWAEVGGPDAEIQPFQRNRNSGSQELMEKLVMKGGPMMRVPDMMVGTSMAAPFTLLDKDPHGIGYTVYFYQERMAPYKSVKACALDGVLPTPETIADGSYELMTEVYVGIRDDLPENSAARRLRDWLLSPTGQAIVEQCGYVPVGIHGEPNAGANGRVTGQIFDADDRLNRLPR